MEIVGAKPWKRISRVFAVFVLLAVCGCGGGGGGNSSGVKNYPNTTGTTNNPGTDTNQSAAASLNVTFVDESGSPVQGVSVSVNGGASQLTSSSAGKITVPVASVSAQGTAVRLALSMGGYVPLQQTVRVYPWSVSGGVMETTITMPREPSSAEAGTQAEVIGSDGGATLATPSVANDPESGLPVTTTMVTVTETTRAVTFSAAPFDGKPPAVTLTVGNPDGSGAKAAEVLGFTGALAGSITYGDPTDPDALAMFPGEFETNDNTGSGAGGGALITAGFARITLTTGSGQPITSFANGGSITVTMRVPSGVTNPETGAAVAAGDTIPVFSFNETTGEWVVEHETGGGVKRTTVQQDADGLFVTFSLTHLTWINLDWKDDICPAGKPRVSFVDDLGAPVTGVYFSAWASGWNFRSSRSVYAKDSYVEFASAPASVPIYVQAWKDGYFSKVMQLNNCLDATINIKSCSNSCPNNCYDGNPNTYDICEFTGGSCPSCINPACSYACSSDTQCDDGKASTTDVCVNPGSCYSYCAHPAPCSPRCSSNADCDDKNAGTVDTCYYPGTCSAQCYHKYTCAACYSSADCNDNNPNTKDMCRNPNTCSAACEHCNIVCKTNADCDDGNPNTGDVCSIPWSCSTESCSHFPCEVACSSDAQCDDDNPTTTDTCSNPGMCEAACSNTSCVACSNDAQCDDGDALTIDTCSNPGTCGSLCQHTSCVACTQDISCDDSNIYTRDICNNANTCGASCTNTPCTVECLNNTECDDGNGFTSDICTNPSTCDAVCSNPSCSAACSADIECDDGNPATTDVCYNPGTCAASCGSPTSGVAVSVGMGFACAIRVDGTAQCWGYGLVAGNLGDGSSATSTIPVNVLNVTGAEFVAAQYTTGVALQSNGSFMCWGTNYPIIEGCDSTFSFYTTPREVFSLSGATYMDASLADFCFLMSGGNVKCYGQNYYSYSNPVDIAGISGATSLTVGYEHSCVLLGDQTVKCWGENENGQLGDGTYASSTVPVSVSGLSGVTDIDAPTAYNILSAYAGGHTCASLSGGGVKCWGSNAQGQLGDGTYATSSLPVDVSGITTAVGVCAGMGYSCAVLSDTTVKCWGDNAEGQLGNGTTTTTNTPTAVSGLTGVADVSCGGGMTCALMIGGGIKCWGNYSIGYLGNGNSLQGSLVPVDVIGY